MSDKRFEKLEASRRRLRAAGDSRRNRAFNLPADVMVSFSGGRTSGYMLRRMIEANGGVGPSWRVCFCNTGEEDVRTLDFVEEVSRRWSVPITWLEYRYLGWGVGKNKKHSFAVVNHATASRHGEPFDQIIEARNDVRRHAGKPGILPHPKQRWCTGELKQKTKLRWLKSLGVGRYVNAIGIRADEWKRWMSLIDCKGNRMTGETPVAPLYDAGVTREEVMAFWARQPFDLGVPERLGNCRNCFLKKLSKVEENAREDPSSLDWYARAEEKTGDFFRNDRPPYRELQMAPRVRLCPSSGEDEYEECHCTD